MVALTYLLATREWQSQLGKDLFYAKSVDRNGVRACMVTRRL